MKPTIYPSVINRACAVLLEAKTFETLPEGYIRPVSAIIKKISISHKKRPILASRATLAKESGKSIGTIHRVMKWLEDHGFIQRNQIAQPELRGSSSPIVPTDKFLRALTLIDYETDKAIVEKNATAQVTSTTTKEVCEQLPPLLATTTDSSKSTKINYDNLSENIPEPGSFVQLQKVKIPAELVWLVKQQALKATALLSLMKVAKMAKQRLSDVVAATANYLKPHKGRALYAYLRTLLTKDKDYSAQVQEERKQQQAVRDQEYLVRKSIELEGRCFTTRDGSAYLRICSNGFFEEIRGGVRRMAKVNLNILEAINTGRLMAA